MEQPTDEELQANNKKSSDRLLPFSILIAGALIAGSVIYSTGKSSKQITLPSAPSGREGTAGGNTAGADLPPIGNRDVILGDAKAPVTFIEYGDYQCPFCGRLFTQVEPQLREGYIKTGKARMVFRNFQFLGPESTNVAAAAECAKDQGKFWAYHDEIYKAEIADGQENSGNLNRALFLKLANNIGLDINTFTSCVDSNKYVEQVKKDTADAQTLGVNSTPTNYINGEKVIGAQPYLAFKAVIEAALQKSK